MTTNHSRVARKVDVDTDTLRHAIKDEYREVATHPGKGFHFHTRPPPIGPASGWFFANFTSKDSSTSTSATSP